MIMIFSFCLCLYPFLSVLSLITFFPSFFTPLILFKLRSVPAVCHNDTISASRPPSLLPLFQLPLTLSVSVSVSFPLTRSWTEKECRSLSLFAKIFFPTLSLPLSIFLPCLFNLSNYLTVAPGFPFFSTPHLLWVTMLRLGCRCHFTSPGYFIVLDSLFLSWSPSSLLLQTLCCFLYYWPLTLSSHLG